MKKHTSEYYFRKIEDANLGRPTFIHWAFSYQNNTSFN